MRVHIGVSELNVSTAIGLGWIAMKFGTHIRVPLRMKCSNFGDPSTFHLAPPLCQNFHLPDCVVYLQNEQHSYQPQLYFVVSCKHANMLN